MKKPKPIIVLISAFLFILNGCATYNAHEVGPTPILQAQQEIPEEELLDVGISVFKSEEITEEKAKDEGTHQDIRKAESHFIPYHLKNTLQQTSHWGAVRVMPVETPDVDLLLRGEILKSNGEYLILKVEVIDAAGRTWFRKAYEEEAKEDLYSDNVPGEKDAFQDVYNAIANDMAEYKKELSQEEIRRIRTISKLKFAADFAPDAFRDYLIKEDGDKVKINRLPTDDDPMMERLSELRERDYMYVDTLNEYYGDFYIEMWPNYEEWRKANRKELIALRKGKRDAYLRQAAGALIMALAVALAAAGGSDTNYALENSLLLGGGAVMMDGFHRSRAAEIHRAAIQELSESFGNAMKPVVMEFQGKKYELTGSAEEQYERWRELLRKIYYEETGFEPPANPEAKQPSSG
ncbi:MAG: hypothetical protein PVH82_07295 [Desulfobacteraceae bacterium]|jgi:hypothetical protein